MYGLWLFKEIETEYGYCKVEIFRRGYNGSQIEIGALSADSLNISLENLRTITDPIGKSVCSFSIIDTEQIAYDDFFTPDATAYKVVVSTKVGEGAYVTRWSGFITPDFFAENLSYRTPISISARDNIGYLSDVDFDLDAATITVRELIQAAFNRIAEDYPMRLSFVTQKQTAEGILAIDATISTYLLRDMSWYEALETILHDLGLQMRWVDNNTIAVLDLSQIPEYYATQGFNFISGSGYREILPAWRQLSQEQNYGVFDNFYRGQIDGADKLEYAANSEISSNILLYQPAAKTQWKKVGEIYFLNFFNSYNQYIDDNKAESIYVTGIAPTATNAEVLATKMVYSQEVTQVNKQIEIKFNLNDTLRTPLSSLYTRGEYNVFYLPYSTQTGGASGGVSQIKTPRPYQLKYRFNIFLRCNDGSNYVMREDWVDADTVNTEQPFIEFTTEKLKTANTNISDAQGNKKFAYTGYNNDEEYSITINSVPKAGTLEFVVYPWTFEEDSYTRETNAYQRGAKISDIQFTVKLNTTGIISGTLVGANHNIKNTIDYQFGEVPKFDGDLVAYAGGLFYGDTLTAINGFQRNADSTNYNLLELVGREVIHFNKKNYNKLSGTIKNLDKEPLMFNRLFIREGKTYMPFSASLNVISNEMNITTMQEVEPYETASFTQIDSEVTTGGATVGGGNNTVLQYSEDAGNAKRVYELQAATEAEKEDGYVLIDNAGFPEAKKVHVSEIGSQKLLDVFGIDEDGNVYVKKDGDKPRSFYAYGDIFAGGLGEEGPSSGGIIQQVYGASAFGGAFDSSNLTDTFNAHAINSLYKDIQILKNSGGGGVADSVDWANVYNKPTTLGGYGITDALSKSGGTINGMLTVKRDATVPLYVHTSVDTVYTFMRFKINSINRASIGARRDNEYLYRSNSDLSSNYKIYDEGNLSALKSPFSLIINNSVGTSQITYDGSAPATLTLTKSMVGLGNVENTALSSWKGTSNITTVGTISSGTWNGTAITNTYINSVAWSKITSKPTTVSGYGITDMGSQTVASADKLTTARSIWGNSFNGTSDINGTLLMPNNVAISSQSSSLTELECIKVSSSNNLRIGYGISAVGGNTNIYGNRIILRYSSANTTGITLEANGNVLIGTTTDNGAKLQVNGNLTFTGDVASGSDARYKSKLQDITIDIATIANAPLFSYKWNDREDSNVHLGTTAQYWMDTNYRDVVNTNNPDFYHLNYGALGVAIGVSVAKKVVNHEERIAALEKENMQLKQQLNEYRRLS